MDMADVPFVDAHVHWWDLAGDGAGAGDGGAVRYPWLEPPFADDGPNGSVEAIARTYTARDWLAETSGWNVAGAVHVDAGARAEDALAETAWVEDQAAGIGLPVAVIAYADLTAPDIDDRLAAQAVHGRVRGIRQIVNWHPDPARTYSAADVTCTPEWARGFAALARHGLSFDLQCYPGQMPALAALFARHSDVAVMVNHLGMPVLTDPDGLADWRAGMRALAALPQVAVKLSGLGFARRDWDLGLAVPLLREAIDLFGPDRCMAASDFPTDRLFAPLDACLGALAEAVSPCSEDERRAIWGGNAIRLYRLADR